MPLLRTQRAATVRQIFCTHCGEASEAGQRAMSVFCPHCHKRVILENYKIRGYYGVVEFATCGDIVVERSGHVVAPIKVSNLTIKGKVQGRIKARGRVLVGKTGSIKGDIVAPTLTVEAGAKIQGFLNICPTDAGTP